MKKVIDCFLLGKMCQKAPCNDLTRKSSRLPDTTVVVLYIVEMPFQNAALAQYGIAALW